MNSKRRPLPIAALGAAFSLTLLSAAPRVDADALILTQTFRPTIDEAATALSEMLLARDIVSEIRAPLPGDDLGDMSIYQCVFDLRIDFSITPQEETRYLQYAIAGGSMYFSGEHSSFDPRNSSIARLLLFLGGGPVFVDPSGPPVFGPDDYPELIDPAHELARDCDALGRVVYDGVDNGRFLDVGLGLPLTRELATGDVGAAVWDPGTMFAAPNARVVAVLDINWLATGSTGTLDFRLDKVTPTENRVLVDNMITYLCGLSCCPTNYDVIRLAPAFAPAVASSPASPASPCSIVSSSPSSAPIWFEAALEPHEETRTDTADAVAAGRSRSSQLERRPRSQPPRLSEEEIRLLPAP